MAGHWKPRLELALAHERAERKTALHARDAAGDSVVRPLVMCGHLYTTVLSGFPGVSARPSRFETTPETHACAIQHHAAIGRRDAEFLADILIGLTAEFPAREHVGKGGFQAFQAGLEGRDEFLVVQCLVRISPLPRLAHPGPARIEQGRRYPGAVRRGTGAALR